VAGLVLATAVAACGPGQVTYTADWPHYATVAELHDAADLVVEVVVAGPGEVREVPMRADGTDPMVHTVVEVTATRVHKGHLAVGDSIEVKQLGGELDGIDHVAAEGPYLTAGAAYLLFLETYEDFAPGVPASLLNPLQAQYPLDATGDPLPLAGNDLRPTRADLTGR
jgi:hypothetical protein